MHNWEKSPIVLIPSLEPDDSLTEYVKQLYTIGLNQVLVIDDGSGLKYQPIFSELEKVGCVVLHHEQNRGKGSALKTGFSYIKQQTSNFTCIITVDADGQHAPDDVLRIAELSKQHPDMLVLGVRDFSGSNIPPKSLVGNRFASGLFSILYGKHLPDTQTGLRAFSPVLLDLIIGIRGERFEYEIQMLITCVQRSIPILTLPIQVIYKNQNKGTHFKPLRDSIKIIGTMLASFIRFTMSSLLGAMVDIMLAWMLLDFFRMLISENYLRIMLATATARVVSIAVNYSVNRYMVFKSQSPSSRSLIRYLFLGALMILLSGSGVFALHYIFKVNEKVGKIICDMLLFLFSYRVQQQWVFERRKEGNSYVEG